MESVPLEHENVTKWVLSGRSGRKEEILERGKGSNDLKRIEQGAIGELKKLVEEDIEEEIIPLCSLLWLWRVVLTTLWPLQLKPVRVWMCSDGVKFGIFEFFHKLPMVGRTASWFYAIVLT
ncbi:hypothetical protein HYC85_016311 [Camellia sinensis]|uniref:Uncharacterized protein n=1 Tax=Camellia sinensis TaxID=4442 RepID=A0A7J7GZ91_CAMSI|nr:hypothetical protein HYC85_016311 [Camellia sinensis]